MLLVQFACLFLFLALGELIVWLLKIPIPGSIIGMLLLAFSLRFRIVKPHWIESLADFLCANLGFFFVPAGVGVMKCFGIIKAEWWPIVMATLLSTVIIIATTGWAHQWTHRLFHKRNRCSHRKDSRLNHVADGVDSEGKEIEKS